MAAEEMRAFEASYIPSFKKLYNKATVSERSKVCPPDIFENKVGQSGG